MKFVLYLDDSGDYRWHLKSKNDKKIACSGEGYKRRHHCLKAIELIRQGKCFVPIWDMTTQRELREGLPV